MPRFNHRASSSLLYGLTVAHRVCWTDLPKSNCTIILEELPPKPKRCFHLPRARSKDIQIQLRFQRFREIEKAGSICYILAWVLTGIHHWFICFTAAVQTEAHKKCSREKQVTLWHTRPRLWLIARMVHPDHGGRCPDVWMFCFVFSEQTKCAVSLESNAQHTPWINVTGVINMFLNSLNSMLNHSSLTMAWAVWDRGCLYCESWVFILAGMPHVCHTVKSILTQWPTYSSKLTTSPLGMDLCNRKPFSV